MRAFLYKEVNSPVWTLEVEKGSDMQYFYFKTKLEALDFVVNNDMVKHTFIYQ